MQGIFSQVLQNHFISKAMRASHMTVTNVELFWSLSGWDGLRGLITNMSSRGTQRVIGGKRTIACNIDPLIAHAPARPEMPQQPHSQKAHKKNNSTTPSGHAVDHQVRRGDGQSPTSSNGTSMDTPQGSIGTDDG